MQTYLCLLFVLAAALSLAPPVFSACVIACAFSCFHPGTTVQTPASARASVASVAVGDHVLASTAYGATVWARVVRNTPHFGNFSFVSFSFLAHAPLQVTAAHRVIAQRDGNETAIILAAVEVKAGDWMMGPYPAMLQVAATRRFYAHERYTLETVEGTVYASGILTTTICAGEERGEVLASITLAAWKRAHIRE